MADKDWKKPEVACSLLAHIRDMSTSGWKRQGRADRYYCSSPYKHVGDHFMVADSITYEAQGTVDEVECICLTLNVNSRSKAAAAHQSLVFHGEEMLKAALATSLSEEMKTAIREGTAGHWPCGQNCATLDRKAWETGGYSLTLCLR